MSEGKSAATPQTDMKAFDKWWCDEGRHAAGFRRSVAKEIWRAALDSVAAPKAQPDEDRYKKAGVEFCNCGHLNMEHYGAADWQVNPNCDYICGVDGCACKRFVAEAGAPKAGEPPQADWLHETDSVKSGLKYIADSPAHEKGGFHPKTIEIAKNALKRIEELERGAGETPAERWIPVQEKLPETFRQVLVCLKPVPEGPDWYPRTQTVLAWQKRGIWFGSFVDPRSGKVENGEFPDDEITHWRPLPLPPGAGSTKEGK